MSNFRGASRLQTVGSSFSIDTHASVIITSSRAAHHTLSRRHLLDRLDKALRIMGKAA